MATQQRAKVGGEFGVNGDFYEGGKFLPSTEAPKKSPPKRKARKVQVEPFVWVVAEDDRSPIFQMVGGQARWIDRNNPAKGIEPNPPGVNYYGHEFHGHSVADLCERFNRGERWV